MKIQIKRIDKKLPLPEYKTPGSVGFDLIVRETIEIQPHSHAILPTNVIVKIPQGYMLAVLSRSSTIRKKGLIIPHGFGVIDQDYHGPDDEVGLLLFNITDDKVMVERGERLGQAIFIKVEKAEFEEVERDIKEESRGGFGSTN